MLNRIRNIICDESISDKECFMQIEEIITVFEELDNECSNNTTFSLTAIFSRKSTQNLLTFRGVVLYNSSYKCWFCPAAFCEIPRYRGTEVGFTRSD